VDRLRYICGQEGISVDDTSLHIIARKADGALRDALSIMDQAIAFCGQTITRQGLLEALNVVGSDRLFEMIECAARRETTRAMQIVDALLMEGHDIQEFLIALTEHLRNLYLARDVASAGLIEATEEELAQMRKAATDFSEQDLLRMLHLVNEAQFKVREAQQPRIQLEITILRLVTMDRSESLNQLLAELSDLKKKLNDPGLEHTSGSILVSTGVGVPDSKESESISASKQMEKFADTVEATGRGLAESDKVSQGVSGGNGTQTGGNSSLLGSFLNKSAIKKKPSTPETLQSKSEDARATSSPASPAGRHDPASDNSEYSSNQRISDSEKPFSANSVHSDAEVAGNGSMFALTAEASSDESGDESQWDAGVDGLVGESGADASGEPSREITLKEMESAWPAWLEQVRKDAQQLVYFTLSKTRLSDVKDRNLVIECQDELVRQMIRQHEVALVESLRKVLNVSMSLKTLVRAGGDLMEEDNDPYAQFKKARALDPKVNMIVSILGAELEY
jgi:DNA polymerase III subunit gamma/tau